MTTVSSCEGDYFCSSTGKRSSKLSFSIPRFLAKRHFKFPFLLCFLSSCSKLCAGYLWPLGTRPLAGTFVLPRGTGEEESTGRKQKMSSKFQYTRAIVCGVPSSLPAQAQRLEEPGEGVDLLKARKQHAEYVSTLKKLGLGVTELEADENCPDCVFVEDPAVCVDNKALIAVLGHESRRPEAARMKVTLEGLGFDVTEMIDPARLDGGDVLFTGREFFVGLSTRSNKEGVASLAKTFPDYPVNSIQVEEHLHLKSMLTIAGPDLIVVGASKVASDAWNEIETKAQFKYQKLVVPEDHAANCLYINGTLVHLPAHEIPESISVYKTLSGPKMELENSELHKVDGCLTCLSILLC